MDVCGQVGALREQSADQGGFSRDEPGVGADTWSKSDVLRWRVAGNAAIPLGDAARVR